MIKPVRFNLALATLVTLGACSQEASRNSGLEASEDVATAHSDQAKSSSVPPETTASEEPVHIMSKAEMDARLREQMMRPLRDEADHETPSKTASTTE